MSDKITYDLLKEVREEQKDMKEDISSIKSTLHINTVSLQEHIAGVKTLKELHIQNAGRIKKLEEEKKIAEAIKKNKEDRIKRFTTLVGAITAILTLVAAILKVNGII